MKKVLFVCLGNICRSPTAEGIFRTKAEQLGLEVDHDSAGTSGYHAGNPPDKRSIAKAAEHGVDISDLRSRQITHADFEYFDHILCMDTDNLEGVLSLAPNNTKSKIELILDYHNHAVVDVPDPYYNDDGFELVFNLLDSAIDNFIQKNF